MSIQIKNLTKIFGEQKAVDDISFEISSGEIVGFLGPNGAGKSTTMKIATAYLPPSSGIVSIAGIDVVKNSLSTRALTGYLPEHNPLYTDMYLMEYLNFAGKIQGMERKKLKTRIPEIIELCGLKREQHKKIEALSKGYRQRVGLAQSLIHDPKVLILDEPTTGLDPNQIIEIRQLIKHISAEKTVLFSTHIMQEVKALCDRVIVINKGKIVADDSIGNIMNSGSSFIIKAEFEKIENTDELRDVAGVEQLSREGNTITIMATSDIRSSLMRFATEKGLLIIGLQLEQSDLENVFRNLTSNNENV